MSLNAPLTTIITTSTANQLQNTTSTTNLNNITSTVSLNAPSTSSALSSLANTITANKVTQLIKIEKKLKLALDDYKSCIERYSTCRLEYERKLTDSCNHFQFAEQTHLKQMRQFIESYSKLIQQINQTKQMYSSEFSSKFTDQYTIDFLIQTFVENKRTGVDRPEPAQFVEYPEYALNSAKIPNSLIINPVNFIQNNNSSNSPVIHHAQQQQQQNLLLNENDFNLIINGSGSGNNSGTSSSSANSYNNPNGTQQITGLTQNLNNRTLIDNFDGKSNNHITSTNTTSITENQQRYTPTSFFSSVGGGGGSSTGANQASNLYSQFQNSTSTSTLNSIAQILPNQSQKDSINPPTQTETTTSTTTTKKSDKSSGLNIFNVDFLGRNKNKKNNNSNKDSNSNDSSSKKNSKFSKNNKKSKQSSSSNLNSTNQYENLNSTSTNNNTLNRDSSSINSEDSNENREKNQQQQQQQIMQLQPDLLTNNGGSVTARSISSITGFSFDLIDQFKSNNNLNFNNGHLNNLNNDVDSEGYSIRPPNSSSTFRKNLNLNKNNDDMNNFYHSASSTPSSSDDSDSDGDGSGGPLKVMLVIRPKSETNSDEQTNTDKLKEISKNLQLKPGSAAGLLPPPGKSGSQSKKTYYYNYGTAAGVQPQTANTTTPLSVLQDDQNSYSDLNGQKNMPRSVSVGTIPPPFLQSPLPSSSSSQIQSKVSTSTLLNQPNGALNNNNNSLLDLDLNLNFSNINNSSFNQNNSTNNNTFPTSISKMNLNNNENNSLYNIDEDKEVESSFQYTNNNAQTNHFLKKSSTTTALPNIASNTTTSNNSFSMMNTSSINNNSTVNGSTNCQNCSSPAGRYTPACFPGRTTPDFRHTASFFEQQSTRASIVSPLTINGVMSSNNYNMMNGGNEVIPIAIAFTETCHAYFKINDAPSSLPKFKLKCFGCMKISFPFAVLKLLIMDQLLPQLKFSLSNLQIVNQDLKANNLLLTKQQNETLNTDNNNTCYSFDFLMPNLCNELKKQHQINKQAAFFNFELLKYEFKCTTASSSSSSPPLLLNSNWSCDETQNTIQFDLNYMFNFKRNLSQCSFMIIMPATFTTTDQSSKRYRLSLIKSLDNINNNNLQVQDSEEKMQLLWQMSSINSNGSLLAKFVIIEEGQSESSDSIIEKSILEQFYQPMYVKFHIDNETLSQVKFNILSQNYKLSLLKEKIESGKYFCNFEPQQTQQQIMLQQQSKNIIKSQVTETTEPASSADSTATAQAAAGSTAQKKSPLTGSLSTNIGSTVDILLNY